MSAVSAHHKAPAAGANVAVEAASSRSVVFMEAMVAAGVLTAYADGEMAPVERRRLLQLVRENSLLASFSRQQIVDELATHESNFHYDPEVAQVMAREKLAPMARDPRLGRLIVAACRQIVPADGVAHPAEYRVLAEISDALDLDQPTDGSSPRQSERQPPAGRSLSSSRR